MKLLKTKNKDGKNGGHHMINKMRKQIKNEKGLTLVELLAVIVILGIIAAIAVPAISGIITNSKYNAVKADAINVINAAQLYYLDSPEGEEEGTVDTTTSVSVEKLKHDKYLDNAGEIPNEATVSRETPHAITTAAIKFSGENAVKFTGATITDINDDGIKGGTITGTHTIDGTSE